MRGFTKDNNQNQLQVCLKHCPCVSLWLTSPPPCFLFLGGWHAECSWLCPLCVCKRTQNYIWALKISQPVITLQHAIKTVHIQFTFLLYHHNLFSSFINVYIRIPITDFKQLAVRSLKLAIVSLLFLTFFLVFFLNLLCKDWMKTRELDGLWRSNCSLPLSDGCHHKAAVCLQEPSWAVIEHTGGSCTTLSELQEACSKNPDPTSLKIICIYTRCCWLSTFLLFSAVFKACSLTTIFQSHLQTHLSRESQKPRTAVELSYFTMNFLTERKTYFLTFAA